MFATSANVPRPPWIGIFELGVLIRDPRTRSHDQRLLSELDRPRSAQAFAVGVTVATSSRTAPIRTLLLAICLLDHERLRDSSHKPLIYLERAKGFEPSTPTLARLCSTPELHPRPADPYHRRGGGLQGLARARLLQGPLLQRHGAPPHRAPDAMTAVAAHPRPAVRPARRARHRAPHLQRIRRSSPSPRRWRCAASSRAATARACSSRTEGRAVARRRARGAPHRSEACSPTRSARRASRSAAPSCSARCSASRPGSVTPFALANDTAHRVTVVLDRGMLEHDPLNYHPLENDRTTAIAPADLLRFIAACGHHPRIVDLDAESRRPPDTGAERRRRLPSRRPAAMFCMAPPGRRPHGE